MYQKSRELTQKTAVESDSEESVVSMESADDLHLVEDTKGINPWMSVSKGKKIRLKTSDCSAGDLVEDQTVKDLHEDSQGKQAESPGSEDDAEIELQSSAESLKEMEHKLENNHQGNSSRKTKRNVSHKDGTESKYDNAITDMKNSALEVGNNSMDDRLDIDELFEKLDKKGGKSVKRAEKKQPKNTKKPLPEHQLDNGEDDEEETVIQETLKKKSKIEDFDVLDEEDEEETHSVKKTVRVQKEEKHKAKRTANLREEVYVDPKKLFTLETKIQSASLPDIVGNDEEDIAEDEQRMTIAEAFADDDVIEEFAREKQEVRQRQKAKDIDLTLPGWGQWGGTGIQVNKKKRKR